MLSLLETLQRDIERRNDMCFGGGKSKVKTAQEIYKEKKPDYGPLPSLRMGDPVQKNKMMTDVSLPEMRTSGMPVRSLLKVNY